MMTAPGRLTPQPRLKILVANKFEEMRQTMNVTAISRNVVEYFSFIFAVFIVVPVTLDSRESRCKDRKKLPNGLERVDNYCVIYYICDDKCILSNIKPI